MSAFVTAYLMVWFAVFGYLLRLASRQRRLEEAVESLKPPAPAAATTAGAGRLESGLIARSHLPEGEGDRLCGPYPNLQSASSPQKDLAMLGTRLLLALCSTIGGALTQPQGTISGTVVNRSQGRNCPCRTTVVLRLRAEGQFVPYRQTTSDAQGTFEFQRLPLGTAFRYLVGANRDEVHYPGPRLTLTAAQPHAAVDLTVYDAITQPNPLTIRRYDITLCAEPGLLRVTERLLLENRSTTCYVGKPPAEGAAPVTLALGIPPDFVRATFDQEFYGRRFAVWAGKVVTGIPWPPGPRVLKFTYVLPNTQGRRLWQRALDLPCSQVNLRVCGIKPEEVACDLPPATSPGAGEAVFQSAGQLLPAGHVIRVTMGRLPLPWTVYARWIALASLLGLLAVASVMTIRRRRGQSLTGQDVLPV